MLDLALSAKESIEFLKEIKKQSPKISVIVLSDTLDKRIKSQCELAGASYFFDKYNEFEKIPGAIKEITTGN